VLDENLHGRCAGSQWSSVAVWCPPVIDTQMRNLYREFTYACIYRICKYACTSARQYELCICVWQVTYACCRCAAGYTCVLQVCCKLYMCFACVLQATHVCCRCVAGYTCVLQVCCRFHLNMRACTRVRRVLRHIKCVLIHIKHVLTHIP